MTPQQFLTEFGPIASAHNGVQKLREMVLQLAVVGALTEQHSSDGTAGALIELAASEKREAVGAKRFKVTAKLESMVLEVPREVTLPSSWVWVRLLDLGEINPRNECDDDADVSFLPMGAISQGHRGALAPETRKWREIKKGFTHVADGDVIVAKITPCFENGKSAVVTGLKKGLGAGTTELHVFRPLPGIVDTGYVYIFLRSPHFALVGEANMTGTAGQKRLPTEYFASRAMPLPPLAEQKRIVAKVDELMALCDRLEALQKQRKSQRSVLTKELLGRLAQGDADDVQKCLQNLSHLVTDADQVPEIRKAILSLAVQGKLVPQDPGDESAQKRLMRLGLSAKFVTDNVKLPSSWVCVQFDAIAEVTGGVTLGRSLKNKELIKLPYLRVANVKRGEIDVGAMKEIEIGEDEIGRYSLKAGDVLLTEGGDWDKVGRAAVWNNELPLCLHQNHVFRARLRAEELMPLWFETYFNSPIGRAYFEGAAKQTTNLASINMRQVKSCPVALPPLAEQKRIVAKVDQLMTLCDMLEAKLRKASEVQEQLATSAVAALTGIQTQEKETMKAPKTELVARLKLGKKPSTKDHAPLASLLVRHNNELSPNALLQHSSLDIDGFYRQLKIEMNHGWIVQPEVPSMKVEERR